MKRVKKYVTTPAESGPGLPQNILNTTVATTKGEGDKFTKSVKSIVANNLQLSRKNLGLHEDAVPELLNLSQDLKLDEFTFDDEIPKILDPKGRDQEVVLDVTALDRYNEDIRRYRRTIVDECHFLPPKGEVPLSQIQRIASAIISLCRGSYYGTRKAEELSGGAIPLLVWILNRTNLPHKLHFIVLRSLGELLHLSPPLKQTFAQSFGVKVLARFLRHFPNSPDKSQLAVYVLTMAAIGSTEVILEARSQKDMEDLVAELSFEYHWHDWPINYGMILQGVLYGPHSLSPNDHLFQNL